MAAAAAAGALAVAPNLPVHEAAAATPASVPRADCGPGSSPEPALQGQVPLADRESGRSQQGYSCNLELVGQYQGEGATWVNPSFEDCAYMGTSVSGLATKESQGTQVIDVSDPANPRLATNLTSPAMLTSPWESLKVNEERGLLAGVSVGPGFSAVAFDVFDISEDCADPQLLNAVGDTNLTLPGNAIGHEGAWSPDGMTYWSSATVGGGLTAIDVRDPVRPRIVFTGSVGLPNHGFELSEDGNRLYLAQAFPAGMTILDVSDVQARKPVPQVRQLGSVFWNAGGVGQHTIPITVDGSPYLVMVDEFAAEGVRFIDISGETNPRVVHNLKLEIQLPENVDERRADTSGNGLFGYDSHYCSVDRKVDPTALACGYFQSGVRVFDITNLTAPREIAYFNPPAQVGKRAELPGSEHANGILTSGGRPGSDAVNGNVGSIGGGGVKSNLTADWCSSPPRFVGSDQLWVTCQDNGFMALRFTNDAYRAP